MLINQWIEQNLAPITLSIIALIVILLILTIILWVKLNKARQRYLALLNGGSSTNLEEQLLANQQTIERLLAQEQNIAQQYQEIHHLFSQSLQKISIHRFSAFEDTGGDMSYSVALLNRENDGFILTSIFGRKESCSYIKPVNRGVSDYMLSDEEKKVLADAMSK